MGVAASEETPSDVEFDPLKSYPGTAAQLHAPGNQQPSETRYDRDELADLEYARKLQNELNTSHSGTSAPNRTSRATEDADFHLALRLQNESSPQKARAHDTSADYELALKLQSEASPVKRPANDDASDFSFATRLQHDERATNAMKSFSHPSTHDYIAGVTRGMNQSQTEYDADATTSVPSSSSVSTFRQPGEGASYGGEVESSWETSSVMTGMTNMLPSFGFFDSSPALPAGIHIHAHKRTYACIHIYIHT
jgi:hypothetical protein